MIRSFSKVIGTALRLTGQTFDRTGALFQGKNAFIERLSWHKRLVPLFDKQPTLGSKIFVAPSAAIVGRVHLADKTTVWYGASLRGDISDISVGKHSNIGPRVIIYPKENNSSGTFIGNSVTVSQGCILQGCSISDETLIDIGSILLEGSSIGSRCIIGPGSIVHEGTKIPDGQYWAGSPAKYIRDVSEQEVEMIKERAEKEHHFGLRHDERHELSPIDRDKEKHILPTDDGEQRSEVFF
eukprot:TRINITY_DN7960_c0_g1_i1.p1 TRINITY_DN7960_c0_g1~~TRINITY_DN7960_c0_g1_i1.p1  ORF type:complete len:240 (+),score=34.95 TRINITY_DN7960_c0_g1_i1:58-777(+)